MFWRRAITENKQNTSFFEGITLNKQIINSLFGQFTDIIKKFFTTNNDIMNNLQLPKIIVIGAESSGKSSLLENILKCPIFPRNISICTKQPIHLILKTATTKADIIYQLTYKDKITKIEDKNDIINHIQDIMNELGSNEISFEEIHVLICDLNLPNFEFYDLPGIRAYPNEMAIQTLEINEYYIQQDNTIILCIVPATTPRLTSYQPISLVSKYKKEQNTIIALTMVDRVQEENLEELVINRITNNTDEFVYENYNGCVAIINRSHKNTKTLLENDDFANEWFNKNIISQIPNDISSDKVSLLKKNININNLINNLDLLYNKFINSTWIPDTINKLELKKQNIYNRINKLGLTVDKMKDKQLDKLYKYFLNDIIDYLLEHVGTILSKGNIEEEDYLDYINIYNIDNFNVFFDYLKIICGLSSINTNCNINNLFDTELIELDNELLEYLDNSEDKNINKLDDVMNDNNQPIDLNRYKSIVNKYLLCNWYPEINYTVFNKYCVLRFNKLIKVIIKIIFELYIIKIYNYLDLIKSDIFKLYLGLGEYDLTKILNENFNSSKNCSIDDLRKIIISEIKTYFNNNFHEIFHNNLEEDINFINYRIKLNGDIEKNDSAIEKLLNINLKPNDDHIEIK